MDNGLGSTMCSFNQLNGEYACENRQLLTDILKRQLGFKGFVLTDFGAAHSTVQSLNNGLDMETGNRQFYTPATIVAAVAVGLVTEATVDEHVHRILRTMFEHGLFEDDPAPSEISVEEHGETAREVAEGGITLLKNSDAVLPLNGRRLGSVAVIGGDANRAHAQGGASHVDPTYQVSLRRRHPRPRAGRRRRRVRAGHRSRRPDLDAAGARPPRRRRSSRPRAAGAGCGPRTSAPPTCPATRSRPAPSAACASRPGLPRRRSRSSAACTARSCRRPRSTRARRATPGRSPSRGPATTPSP